MKIKVVVIGGGAAGTTAALEIRKRLRDAKITIIESQRYTQYSPCALPFVVSNHIKDFNDIILHSDRFYKEVAKIDLQLETKVLSIEPDRKRVICENGTITYDKLVIATGSYPFIPPIRGLDKEDMGNRIFVFKNMDDAKKIEMASDKAEKAIIVGAGLVGMEAAVALKERGLDVLVVEMLPQVMPQMIDFDMASIVAKHLASKGIDIWLERKV
ncbi:MAG: NAD(P)/FAD-dependent oxidoreductase, partial [Candidatus Methanofastidiosia archaeon]